MLPVFRSLTVAVLLAMGVTLWWYPAATLVMVEPVAWGQLHEQQYAPRQRASPFLSSAVIEQSRQSRPFMPMAEFIQNQVGGAMLEVEAGEWSRDLPGSDGDRAWLAPDRVPVTDPPRGWVHLALRDGEALDFYRLQWVDPLQHLGDIPPAQAHPFRGFPLLWACMGIVLVVMLALPVRESPAQASNLARGMRAGLGLLFFFLPPTLVSLWLSQRSAPDAVYALIVIGGMLALTGLVTALIFGRQYAWLRRLMAGEGLLAHWQLAPEHWRDFVQRDMRRSRGEKLARLVMVAVMAVVVGLGFVLFAPDRGAGLVVAGVLTGMVLLLALIVLLMPLWTRRRLLQALPQVWLGLEGVCIGHQAHHWSGLGSRLESARLQRGKQGRPARIELTYSGLRGVSSGRGVYVYRDQQNVVVPVPPGKEAEAEGVIARLRAGRGK
ncbi:hypothetical protein [Ectothiorhodospira shaposhnikovii]|uniref:hypothetical protein n=1 Tax=Ectothiorhodospira shaposhnikovii TaxID=1054 RepID=UPI0039A07C8B